ncbi:BZ3500_MvSof-1268-A1-R1_Chr12-3g04008 [Microbotryum saponariae]|uniref:BZ3500_MvSof-1268-A1-R1_Chr12-3g04008 protein n=1 Tax=Microbotryum saponariae TaxID=289078 RepID=A0A2X0LCM4_9BASI|nr:BZ3500_MvSof-1268-A1-R1_Chr12-3g04008 [Microbotryum saponariae]SDA02528.1 BZ3501_MvSof-1269-A2-R1_Chr12-3g03663 [Microbotryum saponariae]
MVGTFEGNLLLVLRQTTSRSQYSILAGSHFLRVSSLVRPRLQSPVSSLSVSFSYSVSFLGLGPFLVSRLSAVPVALSYLVSLVFGLGPVSSPYHFISSLIDRFAIP